MATPKTLKVIDRAKAEGLIAKHLKAGTGYWEGGAVGVSDFIYQRGGRDWLIRPPCWAGGNYETGVVAM